MKSAVLGKDLLGLERLSPDQIRLVLDTAEPFKEVSERPIKKVPALRGKTIVNLFFEASTRTRISFEFAEKRLSADTVNVAATGSSVSKGETLVDTAKNLEAMRIDMVVIRHGSSGAAEFLGNRIASNVINAGDGKHEHPTQALLDLLTIRDKHGKIQGLKVCLVGDVLHSRVARSNIWGLSKLGAEVAVCGPWTLLPRGIEELGVKVFSRVEEAIEWADVLNVLRLQLERMEKGFIPSLREYYRVFGVTPERLERAPRMHDRDLPRRALDPLRRDADNPIVLAQAWDEPLLHTLELQPQHVEHVGPFDGFLDAAEDLHAQLLDAARQQRPRPADGDFRAEFAQSPDVGARHARVQDITDQADLESLDLAVLVADGQQIEQRLGGMLVLAVARIDHVRRDPVAEELGGTGRAVTNHHHVDAHRLEILGRIDQRLALRHGRARRRHVDCIGRKALLGELERDARARGRLEEEIDDRLAAQCRDLLDW